MVTYRSEIKIRPVYHVRSDSADEPAEEVSEDDSTSEPELLEQRDQPRQSLNQVSARKYNRVVVNH